MTFLNGLVLPRWLLGLNIVALLLVLANVLVNTPTAGSLVLLAICAACTALCWVKRPR